MARNPTSEKMKGAEGILADVFDHSAIGLAIFDDRLRYRALNSGLAAMHGIPAESHFGKTLREILGAVASRVEPAVQQVLTTGRPILNLEITGVLPTRAGRRRWVDHLFPLKDATGRVKQVGVVVVGSGQQHPAIAGEDLHLADRLVWQSVAKRRRFDAEAGHRTAEGDGLQLRHDQRHETVPEGGVDQPFIGDHALYVRGTGFGVHREHVVESAHVQPGPAVRRGEPEQVRCLLGQPD